MDNSLPGCGKAAAPPTVLCCAGFRGDSMEVRVVLNAMDWLSVVLVFHSEGHELRCIHGRLKTLVL